MVLYDFPPDDDYGKPRKVHALYDFEAQPGSGELTIRCGDVLTVLRTDVGEGWWEGKNTRGETGLFPEAYVEEMPSDSEDGPPAMAPPPLPADYNSNGGGQQLGWTNPTNPTPAKDTNEDDDWGNSGWGLPAGGPTSADSSKQQAQPTWNANDYNQAGSSAASAAASTAHNLASSSANTNQAYDQDDWDSDFDDQPEPGSRPAAPAGGGGMLAVPQKNAQMGSTGDLSSAGKKMSGAGAAGTARTNFNRFSPFVKSGSENYILGKLNVNVQESDVIRVLEMSDGRHAWQNTQQPFNCAIASPKKESKLKGLKSFIAYQLTPSFNNIQVSRRYKHFDWLHERLVEKYCFIPIPPLPDKQIQGRYEEEFIEHRMYQLQSFVDRMCRHPVLSQSEVWQHFLTCTDEKRWKTGKRRAEKDPLLSGALFLAVKTPDKPLEQGQLDHQMSVFTTFTNHFDVAVKNMLKTAADQTQKYQTHFKREHQTVGKAFLQLGAACQQDGITSSLNLANAITITGEAYEEIGRMFEDQPRNDWERLGDMMHDYRGLLSGWPNVLQIHAGSVGKRREFEKLALEGKVNQSESMEISARSDTLSYALLAEIGTFHQQKAKDLKAANQKFLQEQIKFYQKITEKLQESLRMYDSC